jgi:hypothetical protein
MIDYFKYWLTNLGHSTHFDQGSKPENHSSNISGVVDAIIELGKYLIGHADVIVPLVEDIVALVAKHKG